MTNSISSCPLVLIRWFDSRQPDASWRYLNAVGKPSAVECATVGWLLREDAETVVVCQSVGDLADPESAQASGVMAIPARCIVSVERLVEVEITSSSSPCCQAAASAQTQQGS